MQTGLREIAERVGAPIELAEAIYESLPAGLRSVEVRRDVDSGALSYHLGGLIDRLDGGAVVWANREAPALNRLWDCLVACHLRLDKRSLELVIGQLAHVPSHKEFLEEVAIIRGVPAGVRLDYEVALLDDQGKTVDWQLTPARGPILLVEAKARSADLVQHLNQILPIIRAGAKVIDTGVKLPDATLLFRSIADKFPARQPGLFLQGAWIVTSIKHHEKELLAAFEAIDPMKLHFATLATSERQAFVLKRNGVPGEYLRAVLRFEESRDLVVG